jgi:hypothetical protein
VQLPDVLVYGRQPAGAARSGAAVAEPREGIEVFINSPDVLKQRYLEIRDLEDDERVLTAVEILSPSNKRPGPGRDDYLTKRARVFDSLTNLVEIDLLRTGPRLEALGTPPGVEYSILISRAGDRPRAQLIPFGVREAIPEFPLPLAAGESEPRVALEQVLSHVYESRRYAGRIDYRLPPEPALKAEDEVWADRLLRERGLR